MKSLFTILLFLTLTGNATAQLSEFEIKRSSNFHFGDGYAESRSDAIDLARRDLIEKIVVSVTTDSEMTVMEDIEGLSSSAQMRVRSLSRLQLRGLDYLANQRRNGSWHVVAYISREQLSESFEAEASAIKTKLDQALAYENSGNYNRAVSVYMDILVNSRFFPQTLYTDSEKHGTRIEIQHFSRDKITNWLNEIKIQPVAVSDRSSGESTEIYITFEATHHNVPVNNLGVSLARPGYAIHLVHNGRAEVYYDQFLEDRFQNVQLKLIPRPARNPDSQLMQAATNIAPSVSKTVQVDFNSAISYEIRVDSLGGDRYRFNPVTQNLSIFDIRWEFGDGQVSTQSNPVHRFDSGRPKIAVLTLNRSEHLRVRSNVSSSGSSIIPPREPVSNVTPGYQIPFGQRSKLRPITLIREGSELIAMLNRMHSSGDVVYGRRDDVPRPESSYIAIIDPGTNQIRALLSPTENNARYNIHNNKQIDNQDIPTVFRGYGSVWFQFIR